MERIAKVVVAGALAISLLGCGRGGGAIATGVVAGAAIGAMAAAAANPPPPEPHYYPTVYVQTPPPVYGPVYGPVQPTDDELPRFDAAAARAALSEVDVTACGGPPGQGHARVTLNPDGVISRVQVEDPANLDTQVAECVGRLLGKVTVAPFRGSMVVVGIPFRLN